MIAANELRIGNWVNVKVEGKDGLFDGNYQIEEIRKDVILFNNGIHPAYRMLYPIPLTEEILLKCGFEYILPYDKNDNWEMKLGNYKDSKEDPKLDGKDVLPVFCSSSDLIQEGRGAYVAICEDSGSYLANMHVNEILYLHQLQNLYFALVGKELEVKL